MPKAKTANKGKRKRTHRFTDPLNATRRNITREIKKAERKIKKLLRLREEKKPRANCSKKVRDEDGRLILIKNEKTGRMVPKTTKCVRLQGMEKESPRHKALKSHISHLQSRLDGIKDTYTPDGGGKKALPL